MIPGLISPRKPALWRTAAIFGGSLTFLLLKTAFVSTVEAVIGCPAWCNYLFAMVVFTLLGWIYHSKVSFRLPLSLATLRRFVTQAIALMIFDYVLYNVLVYVLGVGVTVAVLATAATVFVIRFGVYVKYVFVPRADISVDASVVESQKVDSAVS